MMSRDSDPSWSEEDDRLAPERPVGRRRKFAKRVDGVVLISMSRGVTTRTTRTLAKSLIRQRAASAEVLAFSVLDTENERHKFRFILVSADHDTLERIVSLKSKSRTPLFSSIRRFPNRPEAVRAIIAQFRAQKLRFVASSTKGKAQAEAHVLRKRAREM